MLANTIENLPAEDTDNVSLSNAENSKVPSINEMRSLVGLSPVEEPVVTEFEPATETEELVDDGDFEEGEKTAPRSASCGKSRLLK